MDKEHKKVHYLPDSHKQECHKDKECYFESPGAEILEASNRKSTRLLIKNNLSSCSQAIFKSHKNTSKYTMKSSKTSLDGKTPISDIKIKEENTHKNEKNDVFLTDTASRKSSTVVPSFKYHIEAKDGIQLIVDLNLKRSDWLRSMEKTVCVCQNHLKPKFESFRQEVECLGGKSSSPDKNTLSDASFSSYVQNKFSIKSMSKEIGKTLPSKHHLSKFDQSSEYLENVTFSSEKGSSCSRRGNIYLENEERINSTEGMELLGEENVSDDGPKRKKLYHKSGQIHGQSHERILRSTKLFGGEILESGGLVIRRSFRLHSKVFS